MSHALQYEYQPRPKQRQRRMHSAGDIANKLVHADTLLKDGATVEEVATLLGVSVSTYFRWRQIYQGLNPVQIAYIKQLERSLERLRRAIADYDANAVAV